MKNLKPGDLVTTWTEGDCLLWGNNEQYPHNHGFYSMVHPSYVLGKLSLVVAVPGYRGAGNDEMVLVFSTSRLGWVWVSNLKPFATETKGWWEKP
jgi:hypothetical protein